MSKKLSRFKEFQSGLDLNGGYRVIRHLAAGTQGDVFGACQVAKGGPLHCRSEVALKRVHSANPAIQTHFVRELTAVFHLRTRYCEEVGCASAAGHPNIVGYLDWFAGFGGPDREAWLVMEKCDFALNELVYVAAQSRTQYERRFAEHAAMLTRAQEGRRSKPARTPEPMLYRFPEKEVVKVVSHVLLALTFLNGHSVIHRDIKTDNILWVRGAPEGSYKLADFGTAVVLAEGELKRRDQSCGTLWTMAPEILGKHPHSFSCDTWSVGCVAFEVGTLEKPFNSKSLLAYKNSDEVLLEGSFWPAIVGGAAGATGGIGCSSASFGGTGRGAGAVAAVKSAATTKRLRPSTPTSAPSEKIGSPMGKPKPNRSASAAARRGTKASCSGAAAKHLGLGKSTSASSLPAVAGTKQNGAVDGAATLRSTGAVDDAATLRSGSAALSSSSADGDLALPTVSGDRCGGTPSSTTSPSSPLAQSSLSDASGDALRARKHAFLKKQCKGRWGYSDELRDLIFDEMLEEDTLKRPTPAELFEDPRFLRLADRHEVSRSSEISGPSLAAPPPTPPSTPPSSSAACPQSLGACGDGWQEVQHICAALKVVTPEIFMASLLEHAAKDTKAAGAPAEVESVG